MDIGRKLAALRKERGLSQAQAAEYLTSNGCPVTFRALSKWENGDTQPNAEQLLLLCELYDIRDVLSAFCEKPGLFSSLNAAGRQRVLEYTRLLENSEEFSTAKTQPQRLTRTLPLYDLPVSAGTGQFLDSEHYELIEIDETVPLSATFAVRISGDSMTPRYSDGQIVYVKQQQALDKGDVGIFVYNGDAYCKVLSGGNKTELVSLNSKYKPITITEYDEFRILGKVVG